MLAGVAVPEAAMHKDGFLAADEGDVRISGQIFTMNSVSGVAKQTEQTPHSQFRSRIARLNGSHRTTALLRSFLHFSSCISEPSGRFASALRRRSASQAKRFACVRSVRRRPFCTWRSLMTLASKDKVSDLLAILVSG